MKNVSLVICAECSVTMDGLPIVEINAGVRTFVERMRMHPNACERIKLAAFQFWDSRCEKRYDGPVSRCEQSRQLDSALIAKENDEKIFVAQTDSVGLPDFPAAIKEVAAYLSPEVHKTNAAKKDLSQDGSRGSISIFFIHNRSQATINDNIKIPSDRVVFVAIDDAEVMSDQHHVEGVPIPRPSGGAAVLLRGVMFVEFFQWLADQVVKGDGHLLDFDALGDTIRLKKVN